LEKNVLYLLSLVAKLATTVLQENVWLACGESTAYRQLWFTAYIFFLSLDFFYTNC